MSNDEPKPNPLEGLDDIRQRWAFARQIDEAITNSVPVVVMPNVAAQAAVRQAVADIPRLLRMIDELKP